MTYPDSWRKAELAQVVTLQRGFDLPHSQRRPGPYPVLSSGEQQGRHDEFRVKGPGFVVGRATNLGVPTWSEEDFWPLNTTLFASDSKGNDPHFLYRLFQRLDLSGFDSGSVQPMLNRNYIAQVPVVIPPLPEQQAIAEVLGALDDKIAANSRIGQTSDRLVRSLYSSLPPSRSFLGDLCVNVREQVRPGGRDPYVGLEHIGRHHMWLHEQGTSDQVVSAKSSFQPGDVLFGKLRPYFHKVVSTPMAGICSTDILVLRTKETELSGYVLAAASSTEVVDYSTARSAGTKMPRASWADLAQAPIRWLDRGAAVKLSHTVTALRDATEQAIRESQTLAKLRDTLLPALMDGRLRVRDAAEQVEGAL